MYRHIWMPTDGSELAHKAVIHGLSLAKSVGAKVTALTVEPSFNVYGVPASKVYQLSAAFPERADQANAHAAKTLSGVADAAKAAGVPCETLQMIHDHPYQAIVATAKEKGCDLIVMASHGRGGVAAGGVGWASTKNNVKNVHSAFVFFHNDPAPHYLVLRCGGFTPSPPPKPSYRDLDPL